MEAGPGSERKGGTLDHSTKAVCRAPHGDPAGLGQNSQVVSDM